MSNEPEIGIGGKSMEESVHITSVKDIMLDYARLTGIDPVTKVPQRYLWTDAFAVCNYLEIFQRTGDIRYRDLALGLVDQVHHVLGKHREDDERSGWISGLDDEEGEKHPTIGGLRIGKQLNEHRRDEHYDERLEWEQDGQYYHYLTKWMHALDLVFRATGDVKYLEWGIELARSTHAAFAHAPMGDGIKRLYWKMSIDLSYPLVPSMGQHDALDGMVTYSELQAANADLGAPIPIDLGAEISDLKEMAAGGNWITDDPLGIGGLLFDASRTIRLVEHGFEYGPTLERIVDSALVGMGLFAEGDTLELAAGQRLPFRELGLSIGLKGLEDLLEQISKDRYLGERQTYIAWQAGALLLFSPLVKIIEEFWNTDANRDARTWTEHAGINMVMLATSMAPEGFLKI